MLNLGKLLWITIITLIYFSTIGLSTNLSKVSNNENKNSEENGEQSLDETSASVQKLSPMKRLEEVPNYGFLSDDEPEYVYGEDDASPMSDHFKRSLASNSMPVMSSDPMKTCMLYVTHLLNLICETDNWMVTSYYRVADKKKILTRCCEVPCALSSMRMHCKRRIEMEAKHHLVPTAVWLRPEIAERLPTQPRDNREIEKAKYSITPNGFFGAFHP